MTTERRDSATEDVRLGTIENFGQDTSLLLLLKNFLILKSLVNCTYLEIGFSAQRAVTQCELSEHKQLRWRSVHIIGCSSKHQPAFTSFKALNVKLDLLLCPRPL